MSMSELFDFFLKNFLKGGVIGFIIFLVVAVVIISSLWKDAENKIEKEKSEKEKIDDHLLKP